MSDFVPKISFGTGPTIITFDNPPERDPLRERIRSVVTESVTTNGTLQTQFNYQEEIIAPKFRGVSKTIIDSLRTFLKDHALKGKEFDYFEDKDAAGFRTVTIDDYSIDFDREIPKGLGSDFLYRIDLRMRRTL